MKEKTGFVALAIYLISASVLSLINISAFETPNLLGAVIFGFLGAMPVLVIPFAFKKWNQQNHHNFSRSKIKKS